MSMAIGSMGSMDQVSLAKLHQQMFKKLDQNSDGKIDKAEFSAARPKDDARQTDATDRLDKMFAQIDTDQDGSITEAESDAFLTKMEEGKKGARPLAGPPPGQEWQAGLMQAMYANASMTGMQSSTAVSMYA